MDHTLRGGPGRHRRQQGQEQEHDSAGPRRGFSGDFWTGTPGDERTCVFHSPKVAVGD